MKYNYILEKVYNGRDHRWEMVKLPNWIYFTIETKDNSKTLHVHSRIHVNKRVKVGPSYSDEFSNEEIIKEQSGNIQYRFLG